VRQIRFTILDELLVQSPVNLVRTIIVFACIAVLLGAASFYIARRGVDRKNGNQYGDMQGWQPISGRWSERTGVVSNRNYGRGDMLIAQHSEGTDYRIAAELRFDLLFPETEYGDAGLVIRTTDPEQGVDSYQGYYAGIRPNQQTMVLGRASYEWHELRSEALVTPIVVGGWYRLELSARGCKLTVTATPEGNHPATKMEYTDSQCLAAGVAGLRSFYTQASWRNVQIARN
jgi:hypothetical protein